MPDTDHTELDGTSARGANAPSGPIRTINIAAFRNHSGQVFESVRSGATLLITKERIPVAILSPIGGDPGGSGIRTISIEKLKDGIRELMADVKAGATLRITKRGEPVAILSPIPDDPAERLRTMGKAIPAQNPGVVYTELPSLVPRRDLNLAVEQARRGRL